jgi:hypothetical protein
MAGIGVTGKIVAIAIVCVLVGMGFGYFVTIKTVPPKVQNTNDTTPQVILTPTTGKADCSWKSLPDQGWDHVASTLITECGKVTGKVVMITMYVEQEADRYHFTIMPDTQYGYMTNSVNNQTKSNHGLDGAIMIELPLSQVNVMPKLHVGQHLECQGPHIIDNENHWTEIHYVQSIKEIE